MTIERAKRLAEQWASGGVCTFRDGEGQEYHRLFLSMPLGKQDVVRCVECKRWKPSGGKAGNSFSDMDYIGGCEFTNYYRRESDSAPTENGKKVLTMAERSLVKCGADWMFCNQDCSDCTRCNFTVTNRTGGGSDNG